MTRLTRAALAVALAAGLAPGAHAQSVGSFAGGDFLVNVTEANALSAGLYTYTYTLTLASGGSVNGLALESPAGAIDPLNTPTITSSGFTNGQPDAVTTDGKAADFTDPTGLTTANPTATITLTSALGPQLGGLLIGGAGSTPGLGVATLTGPGAAAGTPLNATVQTVQTETQSGGVYTDTLTATLLSGASGAFVNGFLFTSPAGNISPLNTPTAAGAGFNAQPDNALPTVADFSALGGLSAANPTATFTFQSSAPLGRLGVTGAGSGAVAIVNGAPAVPEADPAALGLAGLALLGLTLAGRRRTHASCR